MSPPLPTTAHGRVVHVAGYSPRYRSQALRCCCCRRWTGRVMTLARIAASADGLCELCRFATRKPHADIRAANPSSIHSFTIRCALPVACCPVWQACERVVRNATAASTKHLLVEGQQPHIDQQLGRRQAYTRDAFTQHRRDLFRQHRPRAKIEGRRARRRLRRTSTPWTSCPTCRHQPQP